MCQVPLGGDYSLLLVADKKLVVSQLGGTSSALLDAAADLHEILQSRVGDEDPQPVYEISPEPEIDEALIQVTPEELASVAAIFDQTSNGELGLKDASAFWEKLAEEDDIYVLNENAITYDEARKLGLTPDEDES